MKVKFTLGIKIQNPFGWRSVRLWASSNIGILLSKADKFAVEGDKLTTYNLFIMYFYEMPVFVVCNMYFPIFKFFCRLFFCGTIFIPWCFFFYLSRSWRSKQHSHLWWQEEEAQREAAPLFYCYGSQKLMKKIILFEHIFHNHGIIPSLFNLDHF